MVKIGDYIILDRTICEVTVINYLENKISVKPLGSVLKEMGYFSIKFEDLKSLKVLGNPKENDALRLLYG